MSIAATETARTTASPADDPRKLSEDGSSTYGVLDIENVGEPWDGQLLCVGWRDRAYVPPIPQHVLDELADPDIAKVEFTKHDVRWLRLAGYDVRGPIHDVQVMAYLLDEAQELKLESCAARYCGVFMDKRISSVGDRLMFRCDDGTVVPLADAPPDQMAAYNERDLDATDRLYVELMRRLDAEGFGDHFRTASVAFTAVLTDMETAGVPVDIAASEELRVELEREIADLDDQLRDDADLPAAFNLGSDKQLASYLYRKRFTIPGRISVPDHVKQLPKDERVAAMQRTAPARFEVEAVGRLYARGVYHLTGRGFRVHELTPKCAAGECKHERRADHTPTTAAPRLRVHFGGDPWVDTLLGMKKRETIVSTFLTAFVKRAHDGRLYGRFKQTGTVTGRLSSSEPNLQNIPARSDLGRRVRELFRADDGGVFIHADYSQLEPRLMAHFSQDPVMLRTFREGGDIYLATARGVFGRSVDKGDRERDICKTYVLGMGYGSGAETMSNMLAENGFPMSLADVKGQLRELHRLYRVYFAWRESTIARASQVGYIETLAGRRRRVVQPRDGITNWREAELTPMQIGNAKIQGSAADIVESVMVRAASMFPSWRLLVQVHDELVWEAYGRVPTFALHKLQGLAETGHGYRLSVPLVFEPKVVRTWADGK